MVCGIYVTHLVDYYPVAGSMPCKDQGQVVCQHVSLSWSRECGTGTSWAVNGKWCDAFDPVHDLGIRPLPAQGSTRRKWAPSLSPTMELGTVTYRYVVDCSGNGEGRGWITGNMDSRKGCSESVVTVWFNIFLLQIPPCLGRIFQQCYGGCRGGLWSLTTPETFSTTAFPYTWVSLTEWLKGALIALKKAWEQCVIHCCKN